MADFDNTNSGAMFVNDKKRGNNSPDFKGSGEPVCPHCGTITKFWISAWKKISKGAGRNFLSLAFTPDDSAINTKPTPAATQDEFSMDAPSDGSNSPLPPPTTKHLLKKDVDFDDDIPF